LGGVPPDRRLSDTEPRFGSERRPTVELGLNRAQLLEHHGLKIGDYLLGIQCAPEGHLAADKRADIQCSIGQLMLLIEVKGQWHKELWTAAETQHDRLYAPDWRADRCGVYLALWFGRGMSKGKRPLVELTSQVGHSRAVA